MRSEPEISRRCLACGASVREQAQFCVQCGQPFVAVKSKPREDPPEGSPAQAAPDQGVRHEPSSHATARGAGTAKSKSALEKLQRASMAARDALEENVKRVEKIRQVSSVVLEEASYDPSLRFVLVAAALFVLFVVLLVLSKVMG